MRDGFLFRVRRTARAPLTLAAIAVTLGACSDALDTDTTVGLEIAVANRVSGTLTFVSARELSTREQGLAPGADPTTLATRDFRLLVALGAADALESRSALGPGIVIPLAPGSGATGVAIQDDSIAWVGNPGLDLLTRVNYLTGDTSGFPVGPVPRAIVLPAPDLLYVVNSNTPIDDPGGPSSISWFTLSPGGMPGDGGTIPLTGLNARFATVGDDGLVYVVASGTPGQGDGRLSIVDPATHREIAVINHLGESPGPPVYHPSGRLLIASLSEGILEIDTARRDVLRGPGNGVKPDGDGVAVVVLDTRGRVYAVAPGDCESDGALHMLRPPSDYEVIETVPVGVCPSAAALVGLSPIN